MTLKAKTEKLKSYNLHHIVFTKMLLHKLILFEQLETYAIDFKEQRISIKQFLKMTARNSGVEYLSYDLITT